MALYNSTKPLTDEELAAERKRNSEVGRLSFMETKGSDLLDPFKLDTPIAKIPTNTNDIDGIRGESDFDFFNRIKGYDQDYLDSAKKFVNQKTVGDLLGTGMSLYSNLTAPLPDPVLAPHYLAPEANMPINLLTDMSNEQSGNLASLGLNLSRVTGSDLSPALGGNLVQGNLAFNKNLGQTMSEFVSGQQQQAAQTANMNTEATANANAANAQLIAQDNLKRSELTSGLVSQLGSIMTQRGSSLLGLKNMNTNQAVMEKYVEKLIKSGNMSQLIALFKSMNTGGLKGSDVGIDNENAAAKNY
jgi:hypothetical protein